MSIKHNNTFIISYDLYQPGQNYSKLIQLIQGYPFWAKIGQSVYIIKTPESYVQVRDKLVLVFDKNDKLFVGTVSAPAAWFNLGIPVDNWIKTYLR